MPLIEPSSALRAIFREQQRSTRGDGDPPRFPARCAVPPDNRCFGTCVAGCEAAVLAAGTACSGSPLAAQRCRDRGRFWSGYGCARHTIGLAAALGASAQAGPTLDRIKAAGGFNCGVQTGLPGFGQPDAQGVYSGFSIDICKASADYHQGQERDCSKSRPDRFMHPMPPKPDKAPCAGGVHRL